MNPYLFIVGCPRSGTTLLRRLVDAHPHVAVVDETRWIGSFFRKRAGLTPDGLVTPALIPRLLAYDRFARLGIGRGELQALAEVEGGPPTYARFVGGLFDLYGKKRGKSLVGDKTPRYARWIPTLHYLWPEARFVHIIRDGRDVCLSVLDWTKAPRALGRFESWEEDPVTTTALWWEWHLREAREAGTALGPALYREVRYEALVSDPEGECQVLCGFLGVPYDRAMLRFHEGRERPDPGLDAKRAWRPVVSGLRRWHSQMPAGDVERFEAAVGATLSELGYERRFPRPDPGLAERAARTRASFEREVGSRRKKRRRDR